VDLEPVEVADDQERRVLQGLAVPLELLIGGLEVAVLALVLPAELLLQPDVGPALLAVGRVDALLEGVPTSGRIDVSRLRLAEDSAQVGEVRLAGGPLGQVGGLPASDEVMGRHGGRLWATGTMMSSALWMPIAIALPASVRSFRSNSFRRPPANVFLTGNPP
jgi:hypothetical protein